MALAVLEDHRALAAVARSLLADRGALADARHWLEAEAETVPGFWSDAVALGWLGLHLPEELGGQGFGLLETAVVLEELGRVVAPGPFLATVWTSALLAAAGTDAQRQELIPGLASGERFGAVGLGGNLQRAGEAVSGRVEAVLSGGQAHLLALVCGDDVVLVEPGSAGVSVTVARGLDPTRRLAQVDLDGVVVGPDHTLVGAARLAARLGRTLAAAEASGAARACLEMAVDYAKVRVQFGRPIGSFQAVKHHCAEMLVHCELAAAVAWEAARSTGAGLDDDLAGAVAGAQALPAARWCAEKNIQILGGIGFTWEHDAHLYLRRTATMAVLFGAEDVCAEDASRHADEVGDARRGIELPEEAERYRAEARAFRARHDDLPVGERRTALIETGYLVPHWPRPWGRAAGPVEQLVIDEELDGVESPNLGIGTWVLLTLVQHADADQVERWIRPSLDGDLRWCQLFSEPNAGSDAAAIQTRGVRVDGGWLVSGQKVWTSGAQHCNRGLATVRTDPDAPKHAGVTAMAIDMHAPGVDVRPLREITGDTMFNEVFFDDVFVPDDDVVGVVNDGWTVARATLGNERVSIGGNKGGLELVSAGDLSSVASRHDRADATNRRAIGVLVAESRAMDSLNLRQVARALVGGPPGPEGNVTKLLSAEHRQRVSTLALRLAGPAALGDEEGALARDYLFARCLSIAGGTSEIVRNLIAERILGLPREK